METAKIFMNGRSQAVRLPYSCRMTGEEVYAQKIGEVVILSPKTKRWEALLQSLSLFTDDYMEDGRQEGPADLREEL
ncbi:MAG: AbrB/MazE/SpoVT family DNA-binding domain-containing protein [Firmicutes bacterium]|nr:AbrB/MazE/SpoVT family DNA-binding domain-containing protein [Bacillota bacterium]